MTEKSHKYPDIWFLITSLAMYHKRLRQQTELSLPVLPKGEKNIRIPLGYEEEE